MTSVKNVTSYSKIAFTFLRFFRSINGSFLSRKKYGVVNFTPTPRQRLRGQNMSVGIGLFTLSEPSDTLN